MFFAIPKNAVVSANKIREPSVVSGIIAVSKGQAKRAIVLEGDNPEDFIFIELQGCPDL